MMETKRLALRALSIIFLWTLVWVFMIFVVDAQMGDEAAQWLAVIFVIVNGVLMTYLTLWILKRNRGAG